MSEDEVNRYFSQEVHELPPEPFIAGFPLTILELTPGQRKRLGLKIIAVKAEGKWSFCFDYKSSEPIIEYLSRTYPSERYQNKRGLPLYE
jgi:hypothetical protein